MSRLRYEGLGFAYRKRDWVLRGLSGEVCAGQILAVLGPNGRGKSTLLRLLAGGLAPVEGVVHCDGPTAFVPQIAEIAFDHTVQDIVLMGRARHIGLFAQPSGVDVAASLAALARLGLRDHAARRFHELSGGQRQLVMLARALASEARFLVLDEPTATLDLAHQAMVLDRVADLARQQGLGIVFSTHRPDEAHAYSDATLLLMGASESVCAPADEVLSEANLTRLYGVPIRRIVTPELSGRVLFVPSYGSV